MVENIFLELSIVIIIAVFAVGFARLLKQPIIIGYIIAGVLVSPTLFDVVESVELFNTLSKIGVALLLFMVGIHLNPKVIKEVGGVSLLTGIGQVVFTSAAGFGICLLLGFEPLTAIYLSVAIAFSSTIIITKLLSDKGDLNKLYGKISVGFLIVQDIIVVLVFMIIASFSGDGSGTSVAGFAAQTFSTGIILITGLFLLSSVFLPAITKIVARSNEFLLIFSLGWCFAIATIFDHFNLSIEIGALLAGMTLSLSPYRYEISSKLRPIRDFFLFLFFVSLGSQIVFSDVIAHIPAIAILSIFILFGNPLIVMILIGSLKYKKRTGFLTGLAAAQISEFSLILIALGISLGHLSPDIISLVTFVGLITIAGSSYFIIYADAIYKRMSPYLRIFERKNAHEEKEKKTHNFDTILFGAHRAGHEILQELKHKKENLLIVDYNPTLVNKLIKENYNCLYGDISDIDLFDEIDLSNAKIVISTIPDKDTNFLFIKRVKRYNSQAIIITVADTANDALDLYKRGATYVITPKLIGGREIAKRIKINNSDSKKYTQERKDHITYLRKLLKFE